MLRIDFVGHPFVSVDVESNSRIENAVKQEEKKKVKSIRIMRIV